MADSTLPVRPTHAHDSAQRRYHLPAARCFQHEDITVLLICTETHLHATHSVPKRGRLSSFSIQLRQSSCTAGLLQRACTQHRSGTCRRRMVRWSNGRSSKGAPASKRSRGTKISRTQRSVWRRPSSCTGDWATALPRCTETAFSCFILLKRCCLEGVH